MNEQHNLPVGRIGNPAYDPETLAEELADQYLDALQSGQNPDRTALLAAHLDLADLLSERLDLIDLMHHTATGDDTDCTPSPPHPLTASSSDHPESIARYTILSILGRSASGTVYHAYDPKYDREVALKLLHADRRLEPKQRERFQREARIAAQLRHPNIVPLHEAGEHDDRPYFDLELVPGETLEARIVRAPLAPRESAELVRQLADALDYAHRQGIVHRDVKPANILLANGGRKPPGTESSQEPDAAPGGLRPPFAEVAPHLTDFGLAHRSDEASLTEEGTLVGTVAYMSPEQAQGGTRAVDGRSDVYSLGVVLYRLLTGQLPYPLTGPLTAQLYQIVHTEPTPPRTLKPDLPRDLETICLKALAKDPADRFATGAVFAEELRRWLHDEPLTIRPPTWWEKARRWGRRNRVAARMAGSAGVLLAIVGTMAGFGQYKAILEAETRAEVEFLAILDQARQRVRQPSQGRQTQTHEILRSLSKPWRNLPERVKDHMAAEFRSVYVASLGVPELRIADGDQVKLPGDVFEVWRVALRPDGKAMAIGIPGQPVLWERGKPFQPPVDLENLKNERRHRLWYSPHGHFLAFAPDAGNLQLWDGAATRKVGDWPGKRQVLAVGFAPDGKRLWACCKDGHMQALSVPDLSVLTSWQIEEKRQQLTAAAFNADATRLVVGDGKGRVLLYQSDNRPPGDMKNPVPAGIDVESLAWSPDNHLIAVGTKGGVLQLWHTADGAPSYRRAVNGTGLENVAFSPDGRWVVAGRRHSNTRVWDVATGDQLLDTLGCLWGFSSDGKTLGLGDCSKAAFCDVLELKVLRSFTGHLANICRFAWSTDNCHLATLDSHYHVRVWNVGLPVAIDAFTAPQSDFWGDQAALAIDDQGRIVAYASGGNQTARALMRDVKVQNNLGVWKLPSGYEQLAYRDGRFLLVREEDIEKVEKDGPDKEKDGLDKRRPTRGVAYDWEVGKAPRILGNVRPTEAADFRRFLHHGLTPNGHYYWWVGPRRHENSRRVEVRKVPTGDLVARIPLPPKNSEHGPEALLSSDGRYLFVKPGTDTGWQLHELGSDNPPMPVSYAIRSIAPDSRRVVVLSYTSALRACETVTIQEREGQRAWVHLGNGDLSQPHPFAFSSDGRYLAWGSTGGAITVTDLPALERRTREFETMVLPR